MNLSDKTSNGFDHTAVAGYFSSLITAHSALLTTCFCCFPRLPPLSNLSSSHPRLLFVPPLLLRWVGHGPHSPTKRLVVPIEEAPLFTTFTRDREARNVTEPHKKVLVAADTGHIVGSVGAGYKVFTNQQAVTLCHKFCLEAYPDTTPAECICVAGHGTGTRNQPPHSLASGFWQAACCSAGGLRVHPPPLASAKIALNCHRKTVSNLGLSQWDIDV